MLPDWCASANRLRGKAKVYWLLNALCMGAVTDGVRHQESKHEATY